MKWFRHFNNSDSSLAIQKLMDKLGVVGYAYYYLFVELCHSKGVSHNDIYELTLREVGLKLRIKSGRVQVILRSFLESNLIDECSGDIILRIKFSKLRELQDKDSKYNRKRIVDQSQETTLEEKKIREEEEEEEKAPSAEIKTQTVTSYTDRTKKSEKVWLTVQMSHGYPREIFDEIEKDAWLIFEASDDPKKEWGRFLSHYLKNEKEKIRDRLVDLHDKQEQKKLLMELGGFNV